MHNYKELKVWKKSVDFCTVVYHMTSSFPSEEKFGITSQIRRAAVSISSNIAEGAGRQSKTEFSQFLSYSYGSACELETQLIIASRIEILKESEFDLLNSEMQILQKMIFNLKKSL